MKLGVEAPTLREAEKSAESVENRGVETLPSKKRVRKCREVKGLNGK
jgi:hypothetical protein